MDRRINTRRKPKKDHNKSSSIDDHDDDVSLVKAAAWAWHQRSNSAISASQSDHQAIIIKPKTSDTTRFHHNPKPSRYKLEAMRMASSSSQTTKNDELTLLDAYEVRSIKMRLDSLILESTNSCRCNMNNELSNNGSVSAKANLDDQKKKKKKKTKVMMRKGIWMRHGVICSTREEQVVDVTRRRRRSSSSPNTKKVPAIHLHECLPIANCLPTRVEFNRRDSNRIVSSRG